MDKDFTNVEVNTQNNSSSHEEITSMGQELKDDIDYGLPTKDFNIIGVLDNVMLGTVYNSNVNDQGEVETDDGFFLGKAEDVNDNNLYKVVKIHMVGDSVKTVKVGDFVVVSIGSGMKVVEFDGRKDALVREENVFMIVKPKPKQ